MIVESFSASSNVILKTTLTLFVGWSTEMKLHLSVGTRTPAETLMSACLFRRQDGALDLLRELKDMKISLETLQVIN